MSEEAGIISILESCGYTPVREVGRGGMGVALLAEQITGRPTAPRQA